MPRAEPRPQPRGSRPAGRPGSGARYDGARYDGFRGDHGAGPVEYLAVVLLIALVVTALVTTAVPGKVTGYIGAAVCKVAAAGKLVDRCGPPPGTTPPPLANRPQNPCYGTIDVGYGEVIVTFPVRYVDVRGGLRLGYQKRKIVTPGKPDRWEVTVFGWGEAAVATPSLPGGQADSDDPLGITQGGKSPVGGGAWLGLNVTGGETYSFTDEAEADGFPLAYAEQRAREIVNGTLENTPATSLPIKIVKKLPWIGGKVEKALEGDPLPPRKEWSVEAGLTAGFSGKLDLFGKGAFSVGGRGWHLMGVRRNDQGDTTFTLRDSAEIEPSVVVDIGEFLPKGARQRFNQQVDRGIDHLEQQLAKKYGGVFRLPAKAREYLKTNWPDFGLTWKGKISVSYQLTTDKSGKLTKYTRIVDTQGNWYGRAADEVAGKNKDNTKRIVGNVQVPLGGERTIEQSTLDLSDPESLAATRDFFLNAALTWVRSPVGAIVELTPEADRMDALVRAKGTKTRQIYDSDVTNGKLAGEGKGKRGSSLVELKLEGEDNVLSGALIWEEGRGWVPWTDCHA